MLRLAARSSGKHVTGEGMASRANLPGLDLLLVIFELVVLRGKAPRSMVFAWLGPALSTRLSHYLKTTL